MGPMGAPWAPWGPWGPHGAPWGPMGPHGAPMGYSCGVAPSGQVTLVPGTWYQVLVPVQVEECQIRDEIMKIVPNQVHMAPFRLILHQDRSHCVQDASYIPPGLQNPTKNKKIHGLREIGKHLGNSPIIPYSLRGLIGPY